MCYIYLRIYRHIIYYPEFDSDLRFALKIEYLGCSNPDSKILDPSKPNWDLDIRNQIHVLKIHENFNLLITIYDIFIFIYKYSYNIRF